MADTEGVQLRDKIYLKNLAEKSQNGDDVAFMEIIKEFPSIYNRSSAQFKDKNLKTNAWKEIASLHAESAVNNCKQRYESIRTTFSRYLKKCKPPSGSGSDVVVLEPKYEHLRWLTSFIKSRSTSSNIPGKQLDFCDGSMSEPVQMNYVNIQEEDELETSDLEGKPTAEIPESNVSTKSDVPVTASDMQKLGSAKKSKKSTAGVKRPWSNEHKQPDADLELCKVMHSFQKSLEASCQMSDQENVTMSADVHYCLSLAERISKLDDRLKVYVRHCIEKIFFDLEFESVLASVSTPSESSK